MAQTKLPTIKKIWYAAFNYCPKSKHKLIKWGWYGGGMRYICSDPTNKCDLDFIL